MKLTSITVPHRFLMIGSLILIGLGGYFVFTLFQGNKIVIDTGFTLKARQNSMLAAELYLQRQGVDAESLHSFSQFEEMPSPHHSIVMMGSRLSLGERQNERLLDWIHAGGHFITTAEFYEEGDEDAETDLLSQFGAFQEYPPDQMNEVLYHDVEENGSGDTEQETSDNTQDMPIPFLDEENPLNVESTKRDYCASEEEYTPTAIPFEGVAQPLQVTFSPESTLIDESETANYAASEFGIHLLQYRPEQGLLTVLSDGDLWTNHHICFYDNAYLLWLLTKNSSKVWLLYRNDSPSLLALLWKHAPYVLISLSLLLGLVIWKNSFRFGPVIPDKKAERRQLMEHIEACGHFFWRHHHTALYISQLQQEIEERVQWHHRDYTHLSPTQKQERLSQLSQLDSEAITFAFKPPTQLKKNEFLRVIQSLQTIRKKL